MTEFLKILNSQRKKQKMKRAVQILIHTEMFNGEQHVYQ